jgi:hypothetical protein
MNKFRVKKDTLDNLFLVHVNSIHKTVIINKKFIYFYINFLENPGK